SPLSRGAQPRAGSRPRQGPPSESTWTVMIPTPFPRRQSDLDSEDSYRASALTGPGPIEVGMFGSRHFMRARSLLSQVPTGTDGLSRPPRALDRDRQAAAVPVEPQWSRQRAPGLEPHAVHTIEMGDRRYGAPSAR